MLLDRGLNFFVILGVNHALEGETGQRLEFVQVTAPENIEHRVVCVEQFSITLSLVDEESTGHVAPDVFYDGHVLVVQLEMVEHGCTFRLSVYAHSSDSLSLRLSSSDTIPL